MLIIQLPQNQLKQKNSTKYLIGDFDKAIRPLALKPRMIEYVKTFKV